MVETVGFNDLGWIGDPSFRLVLGVPQTEKLRITERFRRLDLGHLEVETTYDDPNMFKQPFTTRKVRSLAPKDEEVPEYVCNENERDVAHMKLINSRGSKAMILRTILIILAAIASALAQPVQPGELLKEAVAPADHRISYGSGELNFGELRLPRSASGHPLLILVHGGCWADRLPNFDPRATSFELLRPMAAALAEMGIATWNVEYARVGNPGGGWPGTFQDLSRAVDYVRTLTKTYPLDLSRVAVAGHSSGGQLALWIAARPKLNRSSELYAKDATNKEGPLRVRAAIDLDGPPDLATSQPFERRMCPIPAITDFMGGSPEQFPSRYAEASATPFLPLGVRQELISGSLLSGIRPQLAAYETAARSKGDSITITELAGSGHFDMLSPHSPYWKTVSDRIAATLR